MIASYSLSIAGAVCRVKGINNLKAGWTIAHLARFVSIAKADLGASVTVIGGIYRVIDTRVGVALNRVG